MFIKEKFEGKFGRGSFAEFMKAIGATSLKAQIRNVGKSKKENPDYSPFIELLKKR